jgi:hypothetical protein
MEHCMFLPRVILTPTGELAQKAIHSMAMNFGYVNDRIRVV